MEGLSIDGGLYMPREWPKVTLHSLKNLQYDEVAFEVIHHYCNESISEESLRSIIKNKIECLVTVPSTLHRMTNDIEVHKIFDAFSAALIMIFRFGEIDFI